MNFLRLERQGDDETLLQQEEKFWKTDFVDSISSSKVSMSVEDERALRMMEESSKKVSGHYQIALPWRQQPPYLPNNCILADQRLQLLKKLHEEVEELKWFIPKHFLKLSRCGMQNLHPSLGRLVFSELKKELKIPTCLIKRLEWQ